MTCFEIHPTCGHDYTADIDADAPGWAEGGVERTVEWLDTIPCPICPRAEHIDDYKRYYAAVRMTRPPILPWTHYDLESGRELDREDDTISPAELKCQRERMGLTTKWLAERWDVAEYSVKRWETNRLLPTEFIEDWLALMYDYAQQVDTYSKRDAIIVPRVNMDSLAYPGAFYRSAGLDANRETGAPIEFGDVPISDIVIRDPQDLYTLSLLRELRQRVQAHVDEEGTVSRDSRATTNMSPRKGCGLK